MDSVVGSVSCQLSSCTFAHVVTPSRNHSRIWDLDQNMYSYVIFRADHFINCNLVPVNCGSPTNAGPRKPIIVTVYVIASLLRTASVNYHQSRIQVTLFVQYYTLCHKQSSCSHLVQAFVKVNICHSFRG